MEVGMNRRNVIAAAAGTLIVGLLAACSSVVSSGRTVSPAGGALITAPEIAAPKPVSAPVKVEAPVKPVEVKPAPVKVQAPVPVKPAAVAPAVVEAAPGSAHEAAPAQEQNVSTASEKNVSEAGEHRCTRDANGAPYSSADE
jgi:hypothetical protein